jgi:hypothetical protein
MAALQYVVVDQQKAARQESSFTWGETVVCAFGFVAQDEFILDQESILDRPKRSAGPREEESRSSVKSLKVGTGWSASIHTMSASKTGIAASRCSNNCFAAADRWP